MGWCKIHLSSYGFNSTYSLSCKFEPKALLSIYKSKMHPHPPPPRVDIIEETLPGIQWCGLGYPPPPLDGPFKETLQEIRACGPPVDWATPPLPPWMDRSKKYYRRSRPVDHTPPPPWVDRSKKHYWRSRPVDRTPHPPTCPPPLSQGCQDCHVPLYILQRDLKLEQKIKMMSSSPVHADIKNCSPTNTPSRSDYKSVDSSHWSHSRDHYSFFHLQSGQSGKSTHTLSPLWSHKLPSESWSVFSYKGYNMENEHNHDHCKISAYSTAIENYRQALMCPSRSISRNDSNCRSATTQPNQIPLLPLPLLSKPNLSVPVI